MYKKHFKDILIGEYFGCWANDYTYDSQTWLICRKDSQSTAVEIMKDGIEGKRFVIDQLDELIIYSNSEIPSILETHSLSSLLRKLAYMR
jgi:hypothetical protein